MNDNFFSLKMGNTYQCLTLTKLYCNQIKWWLWHHWCVTLSQTKGTRQGIPEFFLHCCHL